MRTTRQRQPACMKLVSHRAWCRSITYASVRSAGDSGCEEVRATRVQDVDCASENMHVCNPQTLVIRWSPLPRLRILFLGYWTHVDEASQSWCFRHSTGILPSMISTTCLLLDQSQEHVELNSDLFRPRQKARKQRGLAAARQVRPWRMTSSRDHSPTGKIEP